MQWIAHSICHLVSVAPEDPSRVATLAGLILSDGLESSLVGVLAQQAIDLFVAVLHLLADGVGRLVRPQDGLRVVHPVRLVLHLLRRGHRNGLLGVLWLVGLHLEGLLALLLAFGDPVAPRRHQLGRVVDPADLGAQVVLLLPEIEGVRDDFALEIAGEADLDLAGGLEVLGLKVGQCGPGALGLVGDEVGVLVDTAASGLAALGTLVLRQILGFKYLANVVILDGTTHFTPEPERARLSLRSQTLQRLLQDQ